VARECCQTELTPLYGVGSLMLSQGDKAEAAQRILEEELLAEGLQVAGWRHIPTDSACLGPIALASLPFFPMSLSTVTA
jgi:glutamate synthase (NADPH) large chain